LPNFYLVLYTASCLEVIKICRTTVRFSGWIRKEVFMEKFTKLLGIIVIAAVIGLGFAGCDTGNGGGDGGGNNSGTNDSGGITYSVAANGNANTTTTALTFTFSEAVAGLTANEISVTGVTKGALTGGGTSWVLAVSVTTAGNITVSIARDGIESGKKTVAVYKQGQTASQVPSDLSLTEALAWLDANAVEGGAYSIIIKADESIARKTLSYGGKTVSVTLEGDASERTILLSENGSLFTVESGVTLTLGNNVTLRGWAGNTASLVRVNNGGTLAMNTGSKISGNTSFGSGGGVLVYDGTFTMNGGEISGNAASGSSRVYGGGVCIASGTFTMSGGKISGNAASANADTDSVSYGGGVYIADSPYLAGSGFAFTMNGGEISGNTVSASYITSGGGVYISTYGGTFTMNGGKISGNTVSPAFFSAIGGGVCVDGSGFTMKDGEISGNTSGGNGGGVYISASFTMSGGEISGNTSVWDGGGVYVLYSGDFTMSGGEISGNTAGSVGGGVYVDAAGGFIKQTGAVIYGSDASSTLKNTATSDDSYYYGHYGHVVYGHHGGLVRNTTAGLDVNLDSTKDGSAGGWE
jgi:hypothetical protein